MIYPYIICCFLSWLLFSVILKEDQRYYDWTSFAVCFGLSLVWPIVLIRWGMGLFITRYLH